MNNYTDSEDYQDDPGQYLDMTEGEEITIQVKMPKYLLKFIDSISNDRNQFIVGVLMAMMPSK